MQGDLYASSVLVSIYTSGKSDQPVNMNKAAELWAEFQKYYPGAFSKSLTTKVVLIASAKDKQTKRKVNKDK